jgi:hypothetical protein
MDFLSERGVDSLAGKSKYFLTLCLQNYRQKVKRSLPEMTDDDAAAVTDDDAAAVTDAIRRVRRRASQ